MAGTLALSDEKNTTQVRDEAALRQAVWDKCLRSAVDYFRECTNPKNGLVADTSRKNSPCSIAVVGFALSAYPIAVTRGWMTREDAAEITAKTLAFFLDSPQSDAKDVTGYKGFYYHFLDMDSGRRIWDCEVSVIDTGLLLAGVLCAGLFFSRDNAVENRIREAAETFYRRIDWQWAQNKGDTLSQGWKPECGFLHYGWEGYSEATIVYLLGLASPTSPLKASSYHAWTATYQWENVFGLDFLYAGPLFIHYFSHGWVDFRGIRDPFMREKNCDYFENTQRAIRIQREYARRNPHDYAGYTSDFWGITAGDGPGGSELRADKRDLRFFGYSARGVPLGPDDGTVAPWAMAAALPFQPEAALRGVESLLHNYPQTCRAYRFCSGFNPSVDGDSGWVSDGYYGLDQGILAINIENAKSGLLWSLMRTSPHLRTGLKRAGFAGGWLDSRGGS